MRAVGAKPGRKGTAAINLAMLYGALALNAGSACAQTTEPTIGQLQQEIKKRDALIENLLQRVEKLERRVGTTATANNPAPVIARKGAPSQPSAPPTQVTAAPEAAAAPAAAPQQVAQTQTAQQPAQQQQATSSAPGQFEVNVQAAEHALERTLTASGALLVPYGFAEVEPGISYTRREIPNLVLFTDNRNEFAATVTARLGLPFESQIDIGLPYNAVQHELVDNFVSPQQLTSEATGNSFGDVTVGFSKTLMHEHGWLPDLIGRISYEAPTGPKLSNGVALPGSGQERLNFSLTALKRQDPLAFVASAGYSKAFTYENFNAGDQLSFSGGVYLATSPETTLFGVLQQSFVQALTVNGITVPGGNTDQAIMFFGASSILGRGYLLQLQAGIGLTQASPKYSIVVSLPIRFGVPGL